VTPEISRWSTWASLEVKEACPEEVAPVSSLQIDTDVIHKVREDKEQNLEQGRGKLQVTQGQEPPPP
jgi:hypothetical protein